MLPNGCNTNKVKGYLEAKRKGNVWKKTTEVRPNYHLHVYSKENMFLLELRTTLSVPAQVSIYNPNVSSYVPLQKSPSRK